MGNGEEQPYCAAAGSQKRGEGYAASDRPTAAATAPILVGLLRYSPGSLWWTKSQTFAVSNPGERSLILLPSPSYAHSPLLSHNFRGSPQILVANETPTRRHPLPTVAAQTEVCPFLRRRSVRRIQPIHTGLLQADLSAK